MVNIPVSWSDIQAAITAFFDIPAAPVIVAAVMALGLIPIIVGALRSIVGRN